MTMSDREQNSVYSAISQNNGAESNKPQIIHITELDNEFVAIDSTSDRQNPKIVPLNTMGSQTKIGLTVPNQSAAIAQKSPEAKPQSTKRTLIIGMGLGLLVAVGVNYLFSLLSQKESVVASSDAVLSSQATPRSVTVAEVASNPIERTLEASGTVAADELIPVMTPATGLQVAKILVDEGDFVTKDQVLAELDNNTLKAELLQAQAAVSQAEARLSELKAGTRLEEIARAQERVKSAQAAVLQAESDLELVQKRVARNKSLQAEGAISLDRLDEIQNQERISRANLEQAQARLQEAQQELAQMQAGERPEVIMQAEATVTEARGKLQYIQAQLQDTIVVAPANGIVAERDAQLGELTSPSETLFKIIENGKLELRLDVPETLVREIRPQQKVNLLLNNLNIPSITGIVREIDPIVDGDSRQAMVKVDLPPKLDLKPGMFLRAAIATSQTQGKTVPTKALLPQPDGSAIAYVVQPDNTVKAQSVEIGEILPNDEVEIISGLELGDRIVWQGAAYLKDGDRITISE